MTNPKDLSTEELLAELARRGAMGGNKLLEVEETVYEEGRRFCTEHFSAWLLAREREEESGSKPCPKCGRPVPVNAKKRPRTLHTLHGEFTYRRNHHYCRECQHGFYPLDAEVGAPQEGQATEGLSKRALDFAVNAPYEEASERFALHYGWSLSTHALRCMVERLPLPTYGAHAPMDAANRVTVQVDGSMVPMKKGWKEAKLGTVVLEKHHHRGQKPGPRGEITEANYIASLCTADEFSNLLKPALPARMGVKERQQGHSGPEVVWVSDGAPWIWKLQRKLCPQAIPILDWYHAVEHGALCAKLLFDEHDTDWVTLWVERVKHLLGTGDIDTLLEELNECRSSLRGTQREALDKLIGYYTYHQKHMNYAEHRRAGRVIGSGLVESGHRHVLQVRMKRAGQHWSKQGAEKMARLRCVYKSKGPANFYDSVTKMAA